MSEIIDIHMHFASPGGKTVPVTGQKSLKNPRPILPS